MKNKIIEDRLKEYQLASADEELNALKEISQEIALFGLSNTDFFERAAFQGGTCLRIVHNLSRFSEDLHFVLKAPEKNFQWEKYLTAIKNAFSYYELNLEVKDRSKTNISVKKAFIKEDSFGKVLKLTYPRTKSHPQKIQIKLEIDTNPPEDSNYEAITLDFPVFFSCVTQDLPSLFSGKCHALLCRSFLKGRDWFDFLWYTKKNTNINYAYLQKALFQCGPYSNKKIKVDKNWVIKELEAKIKTIDWKMASEDVIAFLKPIEIDSLKLWDEDFFINRLKQL